MRGLRSPLYLDYSTFTEGIYELRDKGPKYSDNETFSFVLEIYDKTE